MLGSIAAVLLIVVIFFGGKGPMRKLIGFFIEETDGEPVRSARKSDNVQKYSNEPIVEMEKLVRKTDDTAVVDFDICLFQTKIAVHNLCID